jgi:hypothetical protein
MAPLEGPHRMAVAAHQLSHADTRLKQPGAAKAFGDLVTFVAGKGVMAMGAQPENSRAVLRGN